MEIYRCSPPESWRSAIEIPPYIRIFRKENKSNLLCFVYNLSLSVSLSLSLLLETPCAQR